VDVEGCLQGRKESLHGQERVGQLQNQIARQLGFRDGLVVASLYRLGDQKRRQRSAETQNDG
jgi:hypothetical protein